MQSIFGHTDFRHCLDCWKLNYLSGFIRKRLLFFLLAVLTTTFVNAQNNFNLLSSSGTSSNGAIALSWSLGDLIIESYSMNDNSVVNGSQFDLELITALVKANPEIQVYPNPISNHIKVKVDDNFNDAVAGIRLFTIGGILLFEKEISIAPEKQIEIDLKSVDIPVGVLLLEIQRSGESRLFKLIKI